MQKPYSNVAENVMLYDTVGIFNTTGKSFSNPPGWYQTYAAMGAANEINFFNVRNREVGLPYNNQDSRDQMPYAFLCKSIGVSFWANAMTKAPSWATDATFSPEDSVAHIFQNDLPRHAGLTFRVQQDDRLKTHCLFTPPGYGPCGDGYGRGSPSTMTNNALANGYDHHLSAISQGVPELVARWTFPVAIEIPRRGNINVKIILNEYARQLLQAVPEGYEFQGIHDAIDDIHQSPTFSAIQVSIAGERLVQQRAQYHV